MITDVNRQALEIAKHELLVVEAEHNLSLIHI